MPQKKQGLVIIWPIKSSFFGIDGHVTPFVNGIGLYYHKQLKKLIYQNKSGSHASLKFKNHDPKIPKMAKLTI